MDGFKFGTVTVPLGKKGPWRVTEFTIDESDLDVWMENARAMRDGNHYMVIRSGTYRALVHEKRGTVMSNTPMEVRTAREVYILATGRVLINGLGLGMVLEGILSKPSVTYVRVIEIDSDVIELVGKHFAKDKRVEIIKADAYEYRPAKGEVFDYVWHDIWDSIDADNLPDMAKLTRGYSRYAKAQGVWSREQARRDKRRYG